MVLGSDRLSLTEIEGSDKRREFYEVNGEACKGVV